MNSILEKYNIMREINGGAFGKIYSGTNKITKELVAIKIEPQEYSLIKNEARIYKLLEKKKGIPNLRMYFSDTKYNYLVIDLLGDSLQNFKGKNQKNITIQTIFNIGSQLTKILESIHNMGIVHRDIKPQNIVFNHDYKTINLIDFGLAKKIIYQLGNKSKFTHIKERKISNIIGSPNYISVNVHCLIEPSRRDDLISMIYILFYLILDELPWKNQSNENTLQIKKCMINNTEYINSYPKLIDILDNITKLEFNNKPDYDYILTNLY